MEVRITGDLETRRNFSELVSGADAVVHLAARVHMLRETTADTEAAYRRANADVTESLSRAAADAGVRRFVFLSSVKVNGERTINGAYTEENEPAPEDAYGRSKLAAEQALRKLSEESGLSCVSLRVPLVYGPGVGANFAALLGLCNLPFPLPLSGITANRRSLLFLGNLNGAIRTVLEDPADRTATFLLSDGEDLSTADLVRRLRRSLNRRVPDLSVPDSALRTLAGLAGRKLTDAVTAHQLAADRLCGSLQIDFILFPSDLSLDASVFGRPRTRGHRRMALRHAVAMLLPKIESKHLYVG